ncbi:MAG: hypothetical protein E7022_09475 [Desulfovibrio desulfuricans]|nr:hypothetical protein [Desulfovibrio desulfuricans]
MNNTIDIDNEKMQRTAFQKWYALNIGSKNSASTISTAINQVRLKNSGKNVFSINNYSELKSVISDKTDFFQKKRWLLFKNE